MLPTELAGLGRRRRRGDLPLTQIAPLAVGPAAQRVVDYAADACGIELGDTSDGGSSTVSTSATTTTTTTP